MVPYIITDTTPYNEFRLWLIYLRPAFGSVHGLSDIPGARSNRGMEDRDESHWEQVRTIHWGVHFF